MTFLPASSSSPPLSSSQLLQPLIWNDSRKGKSAREESQEGERKGRREIFPSTKASAEFAHSNIPTTSPLNPRPRFRIETSICPTGGIGKKKRTSGSPAVEFSSFSPCYAKLRLEDAAQPRNAFEFYVVLAPIHKVEVHVDSFLIQQQEEGEEEEEEEGSGVFEIEEEEEANRPKMKAVVRKEKFVLSDEKKREKKKESCWKEGYSGEKTGSVCTPGGGGGEKGQRGG